MKKTLFIAVLFANFTFGQNCKYKINTIDEFTKSQILQTKDELLTVSGMGFGFSASYAFKKIDNTRYLRLGVSSPSIFTLKKGDEILFKTENENPVSLKFPETIIADGQYNSSLKTTHWGTYILIPISDDVYSRFQNEKILKLRIYTADGYIDDDVKEKRAVKFKELLNCI